MFFLICLIVGALAGIVQALGARRPGRALARLALELCGMILLGAWLEYGTIQPCGVLAQQMVRSEVAAGRLSSLGYLMTPVVRLRLENGAGEGACLERLAAQVLDHAREWASPDSSPTRNWDGGRIRRAYETGQP
jgi:hypothetical protein